MPPKQLKRLRRSFVIGLAGGLAGSATKLIGEAVVPPRKPGEEPPPPALLAEKAMRRNLSKNEKTVATQLFHWTFGALIGGVYGVVAELYPQATIGYGVGFGWILMLLTHESMLPALGVSPAPWKQGPKEIASELITHAMYGATMEAVRGWTSATYLTDSEA